MREEKRKKKRQSRRKRRKKAEAKPQQPQPGALPHPLCHSQPQSRTTEGAGLYVTGPACRAPSVSRRVLNVSRAGAVPDGGGRRPVGRPTDRRSLRSQGRLGSVPKCRGAVSHQGLLAARHAQDRSRGCFRSLAAANHAPRPLFRVRLCLVEGGL